MDVLSSNRWLFPALTAMELSQMVRKMEFGRKDVLEYDETVFHYKNLIHKHHCVGDTSNVAQGFIPQAIASLQF